MFEEIERLTRALCAEHGTSGCEGDVFKVCLLYTSDAADDAISV